MYLHSKSNFSLLFLMIFKNVISTPVNKTALSSTESMDIIEVISIIFNMTVLTSSEGHPTDNSTHHLNRVKRQEGESKYTQASKMGEVKIIRLLSAMVGNPFRSNYIGAAHPFHHEAPKAVVILFKQKILDFLFPRIGERTD